MAVGGALRAAMKAGNWASAARESRRRARALAQLNASGGIQQRGVSPAQWMRDQGFPKMVPSGAPIQRRPAAFMNQFERSPIEAPYEGVRVWPPSRRMIGERPVWQGRGRAPYMDIDMDYAPGAYGSDFIYSPYPSMPAEMNVPRAFGGAEPFYSSAPPVAARAGVIPFEQVMAARGSLIPPNRFPDIPF